MSSLHKGDAIHCAKHDDQLLFGLDSLRFGASRFRLSRDIPRPGYWKVAERWFRILIPIRCNMYRYSYEMFGWLMHKFFRILHACIYWVIDMLIVNREVTVTILDPYHQHYQSWQFEMCSRGRQDCQWIWLILFWRILERCQKVSEMGSKWKGNIWLLLPPFTRSWVRAAFL